MRRVHAQCLVVRKNKLTVEDRHNGRNTDSSLTIWLLIVYSNLTVYPLLNLRSPRACGTSLVRWMALQCAKRTARRLALQCAALKRHARRLALRAGYWPTCLTDGHMVVNDHTRSAENWKCVVLPSSDRWQQCVREAPLHAYSVDGTTTLIGCFVCCFALIQLIRHMAAHIGLHTYRDHIHIYL